MKRVKKFFVISMIIVMAMSSSSINIATQLNVNEVFSVVAQAANAKTHLNKTKKTIYIGKKYTLKLLNKKGKTITATKAKWSSSNKKIATVNKKGVVTGKKAGKAKITATYKGKKYVATITVKSTVSVNKTKITLSADSTKRKAVTVTIKENSTIWSQVVMGGDLIDTEWCDEWDGETATLYIFPTGDGFGKAKVKVYSDAHPESYVYVDVTVKPAAYREPTEFGDLTGNVTYYYNDFKGDVSDTGSRVILIPMNGRALGLKLKEGEYAKWWSYPSSEWNEEYGIYGTKVDGKGEYYISNVPAGKYILFVISNKTTCGDWFDDEEAYAESVADCVGGYLSKSAARELGEAVSYNKYYFTTVTIENNEIAHKSVDFGVTYI